VSYWDDAGLRRRLVDLVWLCLRHPLGVASDLRDRRRWRREEPVRRLATLAPAAHRLARSGERHLHAHFAAGAALDALRLGRLLGVPYSVATHGYDLFQSPCNLREKHERAAFAVSDCDYSVAHVRGQLTAEHARRVHRLVLGVDARRFERRQPYPGGTHVLAVARLVEKKGLRYLIEAAGVLEARGAPGRVSIVGEGPLRHELEALIEQLGVGARVELLGARSPDEVRELLERADLFAMPCVVASDGDRDTQPVVVKEALAMEVPVVASDEVGLPEVIRPEWGRLVPPADPEALAGALAELLALPAERRAEMGGAGRAFVLEHCNIERETSRLVALVSRYAPEGRW
jgi:colanic acid/amylovoran biosynthesis glycosyltransferase